MGRVGGKKTLIGRGGSFPVGFCGTGLSKKAPAELDLLANKQRSRSHRESRPGQCRPPTKVWGGWGQGQREKLGGRKKVERGERKEKRGEETDGETRGEGKKGERKQEGEERGRGESGGKERRRKRQSSEERRKKEEVERRG